MHNYLNSNAITANTITAYPRFDEIAELRGKLDALQYQNMVLTGHVNALQARVYNLEEAVKLLMEDRLGLDNAD